MKRNVVEANYDTIDVLLPSDAAGFLGRRRVPSTPPVGEPAPADGRPPESALAWLGRRSFGAYVHVPSCAARCAGREPTTWLARGGASGAAALFARDVCRSGAGRG
ncbi:MAG: hypothetical protein R2734_15530 [Nocardioides sp.]